MRPNHRLAIAGVAAVAWGILPLLLFLPRNALPEWAEKAILANCLPGSTLAYVLLGGAHSEGMQFFPAVAAVFTAFIMFAATWLVLWLWAKRRRA